MIYDRSELPSIVSLISDLDFLHRLQFFGLRTVSLCFCLTHRFGVYTSFLLLPILEFALLLHSRFAHFVSVINHRTHYQDVFMTWKSTMTAPRSLNTPSRKQCHSPTRVRTSLFGTLLCTIRSPTKELQMHWRQADCSQYGKLTRYIHVT